MANNNLTAAKKAKNDEFYTQFSDIQKEINAYTEYDKDTFKDKTILLPCDDPEWSNFTKFFAQNFKVFGLKKLISTSYAHNSKAFKGEYQPSLFETDETQYDKVKTVNNGKIFILDHDKTGDGKIDIYDLEWQYLQGDGDFRSDEITQLLDEVDIIITNPPFSLFREFLAWLMKYDKQFLMIGNMNAVTYKEVFPLLKGNKIWLGGQHPKAFKQPDGEMQIFGNINWFTNIEHGRRHELLSLMTMADNLKFNNKIDSYPKYDNYDAIEVSYTKAIPSDYEGAMGVPISFMDKFCPEQFEIVGMAEDNGRGFSGGIWDGKNPHCVINGKNKFKRIFIRNKQL